jgi:hypothetical protein
MSTNKQFIALELNRLTASVRGMNPRLRGDGSPCAHAFAMRAQGIDSTD